MRAVAICGTLMLVSALLLAPSSWAGTLEDPEITDPSSDQAPAGTTSAPAACCPGADVRAGFIGETATHIVVNVDLGAGIIPGATATSEWTFDLLGTTYVASGSIDSDGVMTPGGVTETVSWDADESTLTFHIPRTAVGDPAVGALISGNWIFHTTVLASDPVTIYTDRAPDADFGRDYTLLQGSSGGTGGGGNETSGDSDGDGLNDTWETDNFGDLNQTADGDPDGDGKTNAEEEAAGTDPNDANDPPASGSGGNETGGTGGNETGGTGGNETGGTGGNETGGSGTGGEGSGSEGSGGEGSGGDAGETDDSPGALISDNVDYLAIAVALSIILIILAVVGLKRWAL